MNRINKCLRKIAGLLTQVGANLKNDNGRLWPPPPVPPSAESKWAIDNTGAVDPNDDASIKAYAFATLPTLPLLDPNMFPQRAAAGRIWEIRSQPENKWIRLKARLIGQCVSPLHKCCRGSGVEVRGDHELFGIKIYARSRNGITEMLWHSTSITEWDRRPLTYAQRVAEAQLLDCLWWIRLAISVLSCRAHRISESYARMKKRGLAEADDYIILGKYIGEVALPSQRLSADIANFNQLTRRLYRLDEKRIPVVRTCYISEFWVDYPWRYVNCSRWRRGQVRMSFLVNQMEKLKRVFVSSSGF